MWFSVRLFRKLHLGLPWWLAIFPFMFVTVAEFRTRVPAHPTSEELTWPVARSVEMVAAPVEKTEPLGAELPVRTQLEHITNVLIALTAVMVVVSAVVLTHG